MANVKVRIKRRNGGSWDILHPITTADCVEESSTKKFVSSTQVTQWDKKVGLNENGKIDSSLFPSNLTNIPVQSTPPTEDNLWFEIVE